MRVLGIDEAGRGPVIGPMVLAGAVIDSEHIAELRDAGVKDSKKLTPAKRKALYSLITSVASDFKIIVVPPIEIDHALLDPFLNLNLLEANKTFEIIDSLPSDKIILDCPSANPYTYLRYLSSLFENSVFEYSEIDKMTYHILLKAKKEYDIIAGYKADDRFIEVSAASILAKVTRDAEIEKLKQEIGIDFGSGYPSDPKTREFLKKNWFKYDFFRKTWSSWQKAKDASFDRPLNEYLS